MKLKNIPKLRLSDLLRRRKMTLESFIKESGITAYGALVERCDALGVQPPLEGEYLAVVTEPVAATSQQDGVIVLEPIPIIDERSGQKIDPEAPVIPGLFVVIDPPDDKPTDGSQKKRRNKKEEPQAD